MGTSATAVQKLRHKTLVVFAILLVGDNLQGDYEQAQAETHTQAHIPTTLSLCRVREAFIIWKLCALLCWMVGGWWPDPNGWLVNMSNTRFFISPLPEADSCWLVVPLMSESGSISTKSSTGSLLEPLSPLSPTGRSEHDKTPKSASFSEPSIDAGSAECS